MAEIVVRLETSRILNADWYSVARVAAAGEAHRFLRDADKPLAPARIQGTGLVHAGILEMHINGRPDWETVLCNVFPAGVGFALDPPNWLLEVNCRACLELVGLCIEDRLDVAGIAGLR